MMITENLKKSIRVKASRPLVQYIMDLIILLLPQVAYSLFARMTNWVAKNYLVNPTNLLRGNEDQIRYNQEKCTLC